MRPIEYLPLPYPAEFDPSEDDPHFFYNSFLHHFIEDMVRMVNTGLHIDPLAVETLRESIESILAKTHKKLNRHPYIKRYLEQRTIAIQTKLLGEYNQKKRSKEYYQTDFNPKNIQHRTWIVNASLPPKYHQSKWTLAALKQLIKAYPPTKLIERILSKDETLIDDPSVVALMDKFAEYKADLWNRPRLDKASKVPKIEFNPGSAVQKQELFQLLEIEPLDFSKTTGNPTWKRDQLEILKKSTVDKKLIELLDALIDYSYGAIIKSTFLKAFDKFTIDGVLYGNIKLFGAKSMRNTSNNPNLLNMPSSRSIYAKPLKRCFVAPKGFLIYAIDLNGLEDRVIANLSGDENKIAIFKEKLDGHSLATTYYYKERLSTLIGIYTDHKAASKELYELVEAENAEAGKLRSDSKPISFGLAYGAFPPKISTTLRCPIEEAEQIFDAYHQELYPGITKYREEYVLKTAVEQGYLHLGLGCRIYTNNPRKEIRTLSNATVQFWSILTLIAINEFNHRLTEEDLHQYVQVHATIYDSIYVYVVNSPEAIQWVNDTLVELLTVEYIKDAPVPNEAVGEIGKNWAELHKLSNNATIEEIENVLEKL